MLWIESMFNLLTLFKSSHQRQCQGLHCKRKQEHMVSKTKYLWLQSLVTENIFFLNYTCYNVICFCIGRFVCLFFILNDDSYCIFITVIVNCKYSVIFSKSVIIIQLNTTNSTNTLQYFHNVLLLFALQYIVVWS